MPTVAVFDMTGKKTGEMMLIEAVDISEPKIASLAGEVRNYPPKQSG